MGIGAGRGVLHLLRAQLRKPHPLGAKVHGRKRYRCRLLGAVTVRWLWLLAPLRAFNWSPPSDG